MSEKKLFNLNLFADFHHSGMAQGIQRLFGDRLGMNVCFPDVNWCQRVASDHAEAIWTPHSQDPDTWYGCKRRARTIHINQFIQTRWDIILISRSESQDYMFALIKQLKVKPIVIAVNGNQAARFDWPKFDGVMSSDLMTLDNNYSFFDVIKTPYLLYAQELGTHFHGPFRPVSEVNTKSVGTFINFLSSYDTPQGDNPCCASELWQASKDMLANTNRLFEYGHGSACGFISNGMLPSVYANHAMTWHFKHFEGYGFSLIQSIAMGRPVIVQRGFWESRTAYRFMIEGVTTYSCDWNAGAIADTIRSLTRDTDQVNENARRCWDAAQRLFDWQGEAEKVHRWLTEEVLK